MPEQLALFLFAASLTLIPALIADVSIKWNANKRRDCEWRGSLHKRLDWRTLKYRYGRVCYKGNLAWFEFGHE